MQTLEDVLKTYVELYGPAKVIVDGEDLDVTVQGIEESISEQDFDIYIVNNGGIDINLVKLAKVVIYSSKSKINFRPSHNPTGTMQNTGFNQNILNKNLVVYTRGAMFQPQIQIPDKPQLPPEIFVPVGTTVNPVDLHVDEVQEEELPEEENPQVNSLKEELNLFNSLFNKKESTE